MQHVQAQLCIIAASLLIVRGDGVSSQRRRDRHRRQPTMEGLDVLLHARRSAWQPHRARPCNTSRYLERPRVSALIQAFDDRRNARQLASRLHALPNVEVIVNDDSGRDHAEWLQWLQGPNDAVLSSANVHEIRAYNRMARMARGDFILLLQGDHCLPAHGIRWLEQGLRLFEQLPRLGLLGGQMGFNEVPTRKIAESISWGVPPCKPIPLRTGGNHTAPVSKAYSDTGIPFMFVAGVNIGPLLARREAFLRVGGFDEAFSCVGEPGIQLDTELSLQMWRHGYEVGMWYSAVSNGVGGRKTRTNKAQKRARTLNDAVNGQRCERLMRTHDQSLVAAANSRLVRLENPLESRSQAFSNLGMMAADHACMVSDIK
jgi:hypothetical protein